MGKKGKKGGGKKGGGKGKKKDKKPKLSRDDELNAAVTNAVLWKQKLELTERQVIFFLNINAALIMLKSGGSGLKYRKTKETDFLTEYD